MKKIIYLLLLCLLNTVVLAATQDTTIQFNKAEFEKYKTKEFDYGNDPGLRIGIGDLINSFLSKYFNLTDTQSQYLGKTIFYAFIVFSIYLILKNLLGIDLFRFIVRKPEVIATEAQLEQIENVEQLDSILQKAISQQNWRLAIRLLYMKTLRILADKEQIKWSEDKTNFDYYYELKNKELKKNFLDFTRVFEDVWYGNKEANTEQFQSAKLKFEQLKSQVR